MVKRILIFLAFIFQFISCNAAARKVGPLIWDIAALEEMKENIASNKNAKEIIRLADSFCIINPIVIVGDKPLHFAPDEHYFCTMGPYRWPDPEHPGQYVWRDGEKNPEYATYDSGKLEELELRCEKLSKVFYLTNDLKYYEAFVKQLRAWFIDEDTYMYPNFEYSQVVPGKNNNKGTSSGSISAYTFNTIIESIRLVDMVNRIDRKTYKALQKWFLEFANWEDRHYGQYFMNVNNNISLAFDVTQVNMYLFAGKTRKAKRIANGFASRRIYQQIMEDGSQPEELKRANAFGYSIYNLTHIIDFCHIVSYWDKDYYEKHKERIDKGFEFLQKYAEHPETFPYQQKNGIGNSVKRLNNQRQRRDSLRNR